MSEHTIQDVDLLFLDGIKLTDPVQLAKIYLRSGAPNVHLYKEAWYRYTGTHYVQDDRGVQKLVSDAVEDFFFKHHLALLNNRKAGDKKVPEKPATNNALVANVMGRLGDLRLLPHDQEQPGWITKTGEEKPADVHVVRNGLLEPVRRECFQHNPDYFSTSCAEYDYDPAAGCPLWEATLKKWFDDDAECGTALAQWFGYCLTKRTDLHKMLIIQGPKRSGKGVIARILTKLIGKDLVASTDLRTLGGEFGAQHLPGKTMCLIPEARVTQRTEIVAVVTFMLSVTGQDAVNWNVKYSDHGEGFLPLRFMLTTNSTLDFGDQTEALASRLLIMKQTESWLGREDRDLEHKLTEELSGICNWALRGLDALQENGGEFLQPKSGVPYLEAFRTANDKLGCFIDDVLTIDPEGWIPKGECYDLYKEWAMNARLQHVMNKIKFGTEIMTRKGIKTGRAPTDPARAGANRPETYRGIRRKNEADERAAAEADDRRAAQGNQP